MSTNTLVIKLRATTRNDYYKNQENNYPYSDGVEIRDSVFKGFCGVAGKVQFFSLYGCCQGRN